MTSTLRKFYKTVDKMRQSQRTYFLHREREVLEESKRLEKKVDSMIADLKKLDEVTR